MTKFATQHEALVLKIQFNENYNSFPSYLPDIIKVDELNDATKMVAVF